MAKVVLHLGSNLGDRPENLQKAIDHINALIGKTDCISSIYETAAWGVEDQPDFLNIALQVSTNLLPEKLLQIVLQIEKDMGRERKKRWGERLIDIDILFYHDWRINYPNLIIPHIALHDRNFVLDPLVEIIPNFIHPLFNKTIKALKVICKDSLLVKKYSV